MNTYTFGAICVGGSALILLWRFYRMGKVRLRYAYLLAAIALAALSAYYALRA
ncbi:MAG: hypothetical protein ISS15_15890 [Alphaproteobacteria bacterium]|nr:hypothetical protein [Alphaproteobacteria bacterium]MBL7099141.1 hypothetical protein [Alphaproteobacteria bacterium]